MAQEGATNITKLNLSKNKKGLGKKAGVFIGDALIQNPDHPVEKINFKDVYLGEDGLIRILEACNANHHIKKLSIGFVSAKGLKMMGETLADNKNI